MLSANDAVKAALINAAATMAAAAVGRLPDLPKIDPGFLTDPAKLTDPATMSTNIAEVRLLEIFYPYLVNAWNTTTGEWGTKINVTAEANGPIGSNIPAVLAAAPGIISQISALLQGGTPAAAIASALSGIGAPGAASIPPLVPAK